ncbi:MAG: hypothetical protein GY753_16945 [Gammaproteobacteria bacterium]|nr:hypothetical protein [Gammaproteobacteria bacterium]
MTTLYVYTDDGRTEEWLDSANAVLCFNRELEKAFAEYYPQFEIIVENNPAKEGQCAVDGCPDRHTEQDIVEDFSYVYQHFLDIISNNMENWYPN